MTMTMKQAAKILAAPRPPKMRWAGGITDEWRKDRNKRKAARRALRGVQ